MAIREVLSSYTFEQQRQMINLIGDDVGDASTLLTPTKVLTSGVNEIVNGDVDLINQTLGMDDGTLASPSLYFDTGQGFYKVDATKIGLSTSLAIAGNLEVDGDITFRAGAASGGTLTFGDLNTDNIVFNAELTSSIVPDTTANYNLGSATKQWNNIWIDGTATIDSLLIDENSTFTGHLQVDSGDIRVPSTTTTVDLFDDYATTVEAFGAGTDIRLGGTTGTLTLRNPTIVGSEVTQALFNTVATTVNAFGAATNINMGVSGGGGNTNFNILSDDVVCSGDMNINGGELLSSSNTFDLLINNNDVRIGNQTGTGTVTVNTHLLVEGHLQFTNNNGAGAFVDLTDNVEDALTFQQGLTKYIQIRTSDTNERVIVWKDLYVVGNLDVSGTQTVIDTTTVQVEDKTLEIGVVSAPSDTTADGGGLVLKATTDKTILYNNTSGNWDSSIPLGFSGQTNTAATGSTTSSTALDHYEEGTWSPDFLGLSSAFTTYHNKVGTYVRIGSWCHVQGFIQLNGTPSFTDGNAYIKLGPLPFNHSNQNGGYNVTVGSVAAQSFNYHDNDYNNSGQLQCGIGIDSGTSYVIFQVSSNNATRGIVQNSAIGSTNCIIEFQLSYRV